MKKMVLIVLLVFATLLSGCDEYEEYVKSHGITAGNSLNYGLVAMCEKRIYFANPQSGWRLYSMYHDGSDMVRLNDMPTAHINVVDGVIYYTRNNFSDGGYWHLIGSIFRMNINGSDNRQVHSPVAFGRIHALVVTGNQIFYSQDSWSFHEDEDEGSGLFAMRTDGSRNQRITQCDRSVGNVNIVGNQIYFSSHAIYRDYGNAFTISTDGSDKQPLGDIRVASMIVHKNRIFSIKQRNEIDGKMLLYSTDLNGGDLQRLSEYSIVVINISNDYIFFIKEDSGSLYKANLDGSDKQQLSDYFSLSILILGNEIFVYTVEVPSVPPDTTLFRMNLDGSNKRRVI